LKAASVGEVALKLAPKAAPLGKRAIQVLLGLDNVGRGASRSTSRSQRGVLPATSRAAAAARSFQ
jgi:hypothetical protein